MSRQLTSGVLGRRKKFPTDGLFSYWKLDGIDGPVVDSWGDADGSNDFGATRGVDGKIGNCFSFVGSGTNNDNNQRIVLPDNSNAIRNVGEVTMSAWIQTDITIGYILSYAGSSTVRMQMGVSQGKFAMGGTRLDNESFEINRFTDVGDYTGFIHYVLVVKYTSREVFAYANNELVGYVDTFQTAGFTSNTPSPTSRIGSQAVDTVGYSGLIDELGIWQRALTQEEITKLYNNGNGITL